MIESVKVQYTNAIQHLRQIMTEANKEGVEFVAYTLEEIGNGFYFVISNENTSRTLDLMCESVKPAGWK